MKRFLVLIMASIIIAVGLIAGAFFLRSEPCLFSLQVIPEHIEDSISGQRCVFLVVVADEGRGSGEGEAVNISATTPGTTVTVEPQTITPEQVAEVVVIPGDVVMGEAPLPVEGDGRNEQPIEPVEPDTGTLTLTILGEREGLEQTKEVIINVSQSGTSTEELLPTAAEMRDSFIPWLAANHPEFGITTKTVWTPTIVRPNFMVVMYYLFFTEEWEMGLRWHVMIPPYDWAEIYLRRRNAEVVPSHAFKIESLAAQDEPQAVDPPESVWR